jgi:hypothetical protein
MQDPFNPEFVRHVLDADGLASAVSARSEWVQLLKESLGVSAAR